MAVDSGAESGNRPTPVPDARLAPFAGGTRIRRGTAIGLAVLALWALLTSAVIVPLGHEHIEIIGESLDLLESRATAHDVIFIGSSLVFRQIDPERFDQRLHEAGHQLSSFNLGGPAMRMLEAIELLRIVGRDPAMRPNWVLFETLLYDEPIPIENLRKPRTIYWHTPGTTFMACRAALDRGPKKSRAAARLEVGRHVAAGLYRMLNVGTLSSPLRWFLGSKDRSKTIERIRGYHSFPATLEELPKVWRDQNQVLMARREQYEQRIAPEARRPRPPMPPGSYRHDVLARAKAVAERYGIRLVFLIPPAPTNSFPTVSTIETYELGSVLDFSRSDRYPELFAIENRLDWSHVNLNGARLFSDRLAEAFAGLLLESSR